MDSAWFAVDLDGHVAIFETGEAGAAPTEGFLGEDHYSMLEELRKTRTPGGVVHDLEARAGKRSEPHLAHYPGASVLMFVDSVDGVRDLLSKLEIEETSATKGCAVIIKSMDAQTYAALHDRKLCRGCFFHSEDGERPSPARYGLYTYEHSCDNWIAGPYTLSERPKSPAAIRDLPRAIGESCIQFDGRFKDTLSFQPAEVWESDSWGSAWLSTDEKTVRPFPGKEDEFAEEVKQLEGIEEGLIIVETADRKPPAIRVSLPRATEPVGDKKPWWKIW
jgi:hypothetical protein